MLFGSCNKEDMECGHGISQFKFELDNSRTIVQGIRSLNNSMSADWSLPLLKQWEEDNQEQFRLEVEHQPEVFEGSKMPEQLILYCVAQGNYGWLRTVLQCCRLPPNRIHKACHNMPTEFHAAYLQRPSILDLLLRNGITSDSVFKDVTLISRACLRYNGPYSDANYHVTLSRQQREMMGCWKATSVVDVLILHGAKTGLQRLPSNPYGIIHGYPWMLISAASLRFPDALRMIQSMMECDHKFSFFFYSMQGRVWWQNMNLTFDVPIDDYDSCRDFLLLRKYLKNLDVFLLGMSLHWNNKTKPGLPSDIVSIIFRMCVHRLGNVI